ncbi:MAG TPA: hypothetical protein VN886_11830 [Acidimicrobiales bacterium]|nr:hypothetical protein [Acidimicrobiales bacterium]
MRHRHGASPGSTGDGRDELWLDDPVERTVRRPSGKRVGFVVALAVCLAAVATPIALALTSSGPAAVAVRGHHHAAHPQLAQGPAAHDVLSALSTTTDSGSFQFTYSLTSTAPTSVSSDSSETSVSGTGTINTNPTGMAASAAVGSANPQVTGNGLDVGVRVDGTDYWEVGYADNGLTPAANDANSNGSPLSSFAGLVESTLGQRDGAVAMLGMASPTGYLDLTLPSISGATPDGTGTVDGVAVTDYDVTLDPSQLATSPGTTPEEATTIDNAVAVLDQQGYTGTTVVVGIDASGFIRQAVSTTRFADGGTSVLTATFADFGCAGTVLMPGQTGSTGPAAGCVSPDTGTTPTTTTTSTTISTSSVPGLSNDTVVTTPTASTTTTVPASTSTTLPATTTTTTTVAPTSTTTTTTTRGP